MDGQMGYDQLRLAPGARKDLYGTRRIPDLVLPIMVELSCGDGEHRLLVVSPVRTYFFGSNPAESRPSSEHRP